MVVLTCSLQAAPQPLKARRAAKKSNQTTVKHVAAASWICRAVQPAVEPQMDAEAVAMPMPVAADLETILQERDACGVSTCMIRGQQSIWCSSLLTALSSTAGGLHCQLEEH